MRRGFYFYPKSSFYRSTRDSIHILLTAECVFQVKQKNSRDIFIHFSRTSLGEEVSQYRSYALISSLPAKKSLKRHEKTSLLDLPDRWSRKISKTVRSFFQNHLILDLFKNTVFRYNIGVYYTLLPYS